MIGATRRSLGRVFVAVAVAVFGAVLIRCAVRGVGGSDQAGYANTARDIAAGRIVLPVAGLAELGLDPNWAPVFTPLAHEAGPRPATMVPYYPPGFPLHLAAAAAIGGWESAPFVVSPVAALLCLSLTYVLGREMGLSKGLALCGAVVLGAWDVFLFHAIQPLSDVAAALWATAAVVAALRARRRRGWALASGAAFGMAVLVRPTNALLAVALAFALPWRTAELALFAAGGLPFAGFYGAWNRAAFGSPLKTGYTHQFAGEFALANFAARFGRYGSQLAMELSPLVPLGGLALAADRRVAARDRAVLLAWFGAIFLVYCFWGPSDNWTYARYLLPVAPPLIVGFLLVVRDLAARLSARGRIIAIGAMVAIVVVCEILTDRHYTPLRAAPGEAVYPLACRALAAGSDGRPTLGVSMAFSAALRYYTDVVPVRYDFLTPEQFAILRQRADERGWRMTAILLPFEVPQAIAKVPGPWVFLGNVQRAGLWELPPGP
ncbi:MAG TPA: hypothetical protein VKG23_18475 [Thermoanaerobaculia bacterium]|nr:hypothetical protein [Thermoanaerobaculia bacterium]